MSVWTEARFEFLQILRGCRLLCFLPLSIYLGNAYEELSVSPRMIRHVTPLHFGMSSITAALNKSLQIPGCSLTSFKIKANSHGVCNNRSLINRSFDQKWACPWMFHRSEVLISTRPDSNDSLVLNCVVSGVK